MRNWSVAVKRAISEERDGAPEIDISSASSMRSWASGLISNVGEHVALGGVIEQKSRGGSGTLDDLALNAKRSLQFEDASPLTFELVALGDVRIAGVGDCFASSGRTGGALEQLNEVIGKVANDQVHGQISVLISKRSAAEADQVKK